MIYRFKAYGHENITARHKTTLEFTKDKDLSLRGDCIVGVRADFEPVTLKKFIKNSIKKNKKRIKIIIEINGESLKESLLKRSIKKFTINKKPLKKINNKKIIKEEINAQINPGFDSDKEMVIRKSGFKDSRTFAIKANKAAFELNRDLIGFLRDSTKIILIFLSSSL